MRRAGDRVCAYLADSPSTIGITVAGPIADLPKVLAVHPGCRVFVAIGDNHARRVVVEKVRNLLLNPHKRISEAAYEAGFQSLSQFNRVFRRVAGEAPTAYRTRLHGAAR